MGNCIYYGGYGVVIACIIKKLYYNARSLFYNKVIKKGNVLKKAGDAENIVSGSIGKRAERIMDIYGNSILRLAYSYLHNISDAEEVLQDTLISFLEKAPVFENEEHEKAWLLRVSANLSKNRIEYNNIRRTDELDEKLVAEEREDLSFVWEAVKELPYKYREVIHLFYYEGYKSAQIAGILGYKESSVRSILRRGRKELKEILKEVYDFG